MSGEKYQRVKEVFLAVCERPADQQDAAAAELCGPDQELVAEVRSLLESHRHAADSAHTQHLVPPPDSEESEQTQPDPPAVSVDKSLPRHPGDGHGSHHHSHTHYTNDSGLISTKGRFSSGTVLAERYRIVSLLGIGGMGEVYRADDLTLDQAVALKFLPPACDDDPAWLERFHNEVRLSRQVTHPNVCRVFDIGQVDGEQFISMEFVDGEDLASLLRRIGRLPRDKALQIARQLCAGLAAAHDRGVLHRDLKPANVMLDGAARSASRISAFPAASMAHATAPPAPRRTWRPSSSRAAKPPYAATSTPWAWCCTKFSPAARLSPPIPCPNTPACTARERPPHPSTFIPDMDPLVERVILRCLDKDPTRRPGSALAVSAALPGGDPLAAALAAGETPSPEMVAAAGDDAGISIGLGAVLLAAALLGLAVVLLMAGRGYLLPHMADMRAPEVLSDRARNILLTVGYDDTLLSKAQGFALDAQYLAWVSATDHTAHRWDQLAATRPGAAMFWYRESPQYMIAKDDIGMVTLDDPTAQRARNAHRRRRWQRPPQAPRSASTGRPGAANRGTGKTRFCIAVQIGGVEPGRFRSHGAFRHAIDVRRHAPGLARPLPRETQ